MYKLHYMFIFVATHMIIIGTKANLEQQTSRPTSSYYHLTRPTSFKFALPSKEEAHSFVKRNINNFFEIGKEILTTDSLKIITMAAPFYVTARKVDKKVHNKFYDYQTHQNKKQPPKPLQKFLFDALPIIPTLAYGLTGWFHEDEHSRHIAQIFGMGFLWAWGSKILLKELRVSSCLRPFNAEFPKKEVHGGNPSGHTTIITYTSTFLGLQRGPRWGIPLGFTAAVVGTMGVITNTHYISQIVAGATLGMVVGYAAHKVAYNTIKTSNVSFNMDVNTKGQLSLSMAYEF